MLLICLISLKHGYSLDGDKNLNQNQQIQELDYIPNMLFHSAVNTDSIHKLIHKLRKKYHFVLLFTFLLKLISTENLFLISRLIL